jgi:hypothetical protein
MCIVKSEPIKLATSITINNKLISHVVIGRHYLAKHSAYMSDELILLLVQSLDGRSFDSDSSSKGVEYFVADIEFKGDSAKMKIYRMIWLFEGDRLEILGVINAYRVKKKRTE